MEAWAFTKLSIVGLQCFCSIRVFHHLIGTSAHLLHLPIVRKLHLFRQVHEFSGFLRQVGLQPLLIKVFGHHRSNSPHGHTPF